MVTMASADSALKSYYLGAVSEQLNTAANPLLAQIKQSTADVWGKEVRRLVQFGVNGGVGAGTEEGELPAASGNGYAQFVTTLKNLYGTVEISDKAVRASENSAGAFVNLLNAEIEGLVRASSFNFGRMLFGDGTGTLARRSCAASATYRLAGQGADGLELTGLGGMFGDSGTLYGLTRSENKWLEPYKKAVDGAISETAIQTAIDRLEERAGSRVNFIVCSWGVKRALQNYFSQYKRFTDVTELAGGYKAITYNGIPIVADRFCPEKTMYLLNTDDFCLHQLCDWKWLEGDDGRVLRQVPGKPLYTATLVKYADLVCTRPCGQAMLSGITEA